MISKDKLIDWLKQHRDYYHDGSTMSEDASHFGEVAIKEVIEHVEQLSDSLLWTTNKPTKEGYYWYRDIINGPRTFRSIGCLPRLAFTAPDIVRIHESDEPGEMVVSGMEEYEWADFDGEWSGPIEPPTE